MSVPRFDDLVVWYLRRALFISPRCFGWFEMGFTAAAP